MTEATPLRGTVRMVEMATCVHCQKDVIRVTPSSAWWHQDTGLNVCADRGQ